MFIGDDPRGETVPPLDLCIKPGSGDHAKDVRHGVNVAAHDGHFFCNRQQFDDPVLPVRLLDHEASSRLQDTNEFPDRRLLVEKVMEGVDDHHAIKEAVPERKLFSPRLRHVNPPFGLRLSQHGKGKITNNESANQWAKMERRTAGAAAGVEQDSVLGQFEQFCEPG